MRKAVAEISAGFITIGVFLLAFVPAAYLATALYFACVPFVYYGIATAWHESIVAMPKGRTWIGFSTGESVTYMCNVRVAALTLAFMFLFAILDSCFAIPILQLIRVSLNSILPGLASKLPTFERAKTGGMRPKDVESRKHPE